MNAKANKVSAFGLPKDIDINKFAAMETENDKTVQDIYHIPYGVVSKKGKKGKMKVDNKYNIMQQSIADMEKVRRLYDVLSGSDSKKFMNRNDQPFERKSNIALPNNPDNISQIFDDILYNKPSGFLNEYISSTQDITKESFLEWYNSKVQIPEMQMIVENNLLDGAARINNNRANVKQYGQDSLKSNLTFGLEKGESSIDMGSSIVQDTQYRKYIDNKQNGGSELDVDDIDLNIDEFEGDLNGSQIQQIQQYNNLALQQGIIDFANANNSANESHLQLNASHYSGMSNLLNLKLDNQSGRNSQSRQKNDIIQESTRRGGFSLWCC